MAGPTDDLVYPDEMNLILFTLNTESLFELDHLGLLDKGAERAYKGSVPIIFVN